MMGLVIANGAFPPSIMVDVVVAILGVWTVGTRYNNCHTILALFNEVNIY